MRCLFFESNTFSAGDLVKITWGEYTGKIGVIIGIKNKCNSTEVAVLNSDITKTYCHNDIEPYIAKSKVEEKREVEAEAEVKVDKIKHPIYGVGDVVTISPDIKQGFTSNNYVAHEMIKLAGRKTYITQVENAPWGLNYRLKIDDGGFVWTSELFSNVQSGNDVEVMDILGETIQIEYEGNKTTATMQDGSVGTSKCNPSDLYDREKGKEIAVLRMVKERAERALALLTE